MVDQEIAGRYRLEELIGRGAMSEVWRASDRELGRIVAIKLLGPTADSERFRREARAVASLAHENVNVLYDFGETADGRPYMVLEYLEGGSLAEVLERERPLPIEEARRIASGIAAGLAHAHARGVVHRDLKPANVLFDAEGRPKLADFGIARVAAGAGTLTDPGTVLGTAATISPEQAAGEPAGPASDVYSLGVILFRMLTGRLPFEAGDAFELLQLHRDAPPPTVESLRADVPPELAAFTAASLAKDPASRPADGAAAFVALAGETPPAVDEPTLLLHPRPPRRRARTAAALTLLVLAGAGGALAWAVTRPPAGTTPATTTGPTFPTLTGNTGSATTQHSTSAAATASTTTEPTTTTEPATTHAATTRPTTTTQPAATTAATTTSPATTTEPTTTVPTTEPTTTTTTTPTTTSAPTTTAETTSAGTTT